MFENMDAWTLVPIAGIIGWVIVMAMLTLGRKGGADAGKLAAALDANAAANQRVADQLEAIERRLAAVEKTLTDIG